MVTVPLGTLALPVGERGESPPKPAPVGRIFGDTPFGGANPLSAASAVL